MVLKQLRTLMAQLPSRSQMARLKLFNLVTLASLTQGATFRVNDDGTITVTNPDGSSYTFDPNNGQGTTNSTR